MRCRISPSFHPVRSAIRSSRRWSSGDCGPINFAGALGVPLWVCLAANCDYRWGLEGDHTPWYARARLFRQPTAGDWGSVFAEVSTSLREMAERRAVEAS